MSDKLDFLDLAIVWRRGDEQVNETKGYELNYIECDSEMDDIFRRVSGFYAKDNSNKNWEKKMCTFQLKMYKWDKDIR